MRLLRRALIALVGTFLALILVAPLALYMYGLSGVDGRPERPVQMASEAEQQRIWNQARGVGPVVIKQMNPYGYALDFFNGRVRPPAGEILPYWIARTYLLEHRLNSGTLSWHLSSAALTIWISRNWSAEEILTVASRTVPPDRRAPLVVPKKQEGS